MKMKTRITRIAAALLLTTYCLLPTFSFAQPGSLDLSFGTGGVVTTDFGGFDDGGYSVAIQTDGKLVVAGWSDNGPINNSDFALVRYTTNGALDLTFGTGGRVATPIGSGDSRGYEVAIQTDGKLVVAAVSFSGGNPVFALVRYTTNGALDLTFGTGGIVTTPIGSDGESGLSVAIQTDGKLVVAGWSNNGTNLDFALVRYTTNGALDNTFGTGGIVTTDFGSSDDRGSSVAIQTDGKLVVAGISGIGNNPNVALARYTTNGSLDLTFGTGGIVTTDFGGYDDGGRSVAIQTDGKLVVAGWSDIGSNYDFALVRYTTNGALDLTFGTGGIVTTPVGSGGAEAFSVVLQTDGKLVVAGFSFNGSTNSDFALVRYTTNGTLDLTFGTGGKVTTDIGSTGDVGQSVAIQTDGKLVVAGTSNNGDTYDFAVVRYNGDIVTSIPENTMEADFTVYPNPNTGILTIALDATLQIANYTLRIMNTLGQEVYQSAITTPQSTIDISTLSKGIYLLSLIDGEQEAHRKIIKE
jgi:uncharacterized delta-60 repeat protein